MMFVLLLSVFASELYRFRHVPNTPELIVADTIEIGECSKKFCVPQIGENRIFIHQNFALVVQKLSKITSIEVGDYLIRPFHSLWTGGGKLCLGKYTHSFKEKNLYGQNYGKNKVIFRGELGQLAIAKRLDQLDVHGDLFLRVVDRLVSIDYATGCKKESIQGHAAGGDHVVL